MGTTEILKVQILTAEDDEVRLGNQGGGSGGNTRNRLEADWECAYELDGDRRTREREERRRRHREESPDPMGEHFLQMFKSLQVKIPVPTFRGDSSEDPTIFKTKALDYMEATDVRSNRSCS